MYYPVNWPSTAAGWPSIVDVVRNESTSLKAISEDKIQRNTFIAIPAR